MANTKVSSVSERLSELLNVYGITQYNLALKTGIPKSNLSRYLTGERNPKQDAIEKIATIFDIDPAWLMGYDVAMKRVSINSIDTDKVTQLTLGGSQHLWATVQQMMELPKQTQTSLCYIINALYEAQVKGKEKKND